MEPNSSLHNFGSGKPNAETWTAPTWKMASWSFYEAGALPVQMCEINRHIWLPSASDRSHDGQKGANESLTEWQRCTKTNQSTMVRPCTRVANGHSSYKCGREPSPQSCLSNSVPWRSLRTCSCSSSFSPTSSPRATPWRTHVNYFPINSFDCSVQHSYILKAATIK